MKVSVSILRNKDKIKDFNLSYEQEPEEKNDTIVKRKIVETKPTYNFSYKGDYFSLPYDDIIYFEKNLRDNSSIVVCENEDYTVRKTISEIEEELVDTKFFKTHRSCIVNLNKIKKINYDDGIIYFNGLKIDLLSRSNKKILKEKMAQLNGDNT